MKEEYITKINTLFKEGGSCKIEYITPQSEYRWMKISVSDKMIDIYPYYSAKVSVIKSRPVFKVTTFSTNPKEMIELLNKGKQSFLYSLVCVPNSEKVTFYKAPIAESDEI